MKISKVMNLNNEKNIMSTEVNKASCRGKKGTELCELFIGAFAGNLYATKIFHMILHPRGLPENKKKKKKRGKNPHKFL